ncbi:hypothetical protein BD626DRAFT_6585 [Schizophyllum amplum]|uniref:Uncharacterized protein n=1 Tax=Schizophyllum amplum TaxID=97359 RepID=A0A550CWH6_9AGAR|nr:hypothetical protein BD626DRAFT_6585 [Auriculariopsis ampla]
MTPPAGAADPFQTDGMPTDRELNPHLKLTQRGEAPATPNPGYARITETPTPHVVIPRHRLFANSSQRQLAAALMEPDIYVILIPYGGGRSFNARVPNFGESVRTLLDTFLFGTQTEPEDMDIVKILPASEQEPRVGESLSFQQPWGWLLRCGRDLRRWLLWMERISAGINKTFSIYPLNYFEDSWKIATLSADIITPNTSHARALEILGNVKKTCWANTQFKKYVVDMSRKNKSNLSPQEALVQATSSWELVPADHKDHLGKLTRVYILTGRPLSTDDKERQTWVALINSVDTVWVGVHKIDMKTYQNRISCTWCKSDLHCAHACPVAKVEDWYGPDPASAEPEPAVGGRRVDEEALQEDSEAQEAIWGTVSRGKKRNSRGDNSRGRGGGRVGRGRTRG